MSAAQLGYRTVGYAPDGDTIAAQVCSDFVRADWDDAEALARFAQTCDIVTWEFENVPVATARAIPQLQIFPDPYALEVAQDRLVEKHFVQPLGGTPAPFTRVDSLADLEAAAAGLGTPGILKTRQDGYDGKGQWRIASPDDARTLDLPPVSCIYEGFVDFEAEFSVILVRSRGGDIRFWDSTRNVHENGILAASHLPAGDLIEAQVTQARELARKVADALRYTGVLTLEFFATSNGPVFNEMAPRVHNSGHWTIEGAATSQFENHIRAIAGLPLGDTRTTAPRIEMRNILGSAIETAHAGLSNAATHLHDYGKAQTSEGRKMGHVTRILRDTRR